jgi:Zn-dependent protease
MAVILILVMGYLTVTSGAFDDPLGWLWDKVLIFPGIVIGITVHEFAHGFVAYKLGDITPKYQKRLSLNPIRHIDVVGLIALIFIGFGWGKPVEVNPNNFRNPRRDNLLTDVAGVITNFVIAILFAGAYKLVIVSAQGGGFFFSETGITILTIIQYIIWINLVLMVFNLLPVPPLDGFGVVTEIFNLRQYDWYYKVYNIGFPILMVLIIFDITSKVLVPIMDVLFAFVIGIWGL